MAENAYSKEENEQAWAAWQCLTRTNVNLFLTGKAGTGKTTFLKRLQASNIKSMVITAPTGVAAINAGGVTLHSFFQIPPGTYTPDQPVPLERNIRSSKIKVIRGLDLLVIDEVSMVRADVMDILDQRLREIRRSSLPFGGVQLLLIGDLMQLSPVVRPADIEMLRPYYPNFYFFSSRALQRTPFYTVELKKIYRQSETSFIDILNQVRTGIMTHEALDKLNSRYIRGFADKKQEGYIRLTTHVSKAEETNQDRLKELKGKSKVYECKVEGKFPETMYPTTMVLELKVGAQVMFIRNDRQEPRRYYNGKIGWVKELADDKVTVSCEDGMTITVPYEVWENVTYETNKETGLAEAKTEGTFQQIPLTLAWAITIHKSQGLTFDKAIIDAGQSFSAGQVYVALSRCRTFEGLVLATPISNDAIKTDREVNTFYNDNEKRQLTEEAINSFASNYALTSMTDLFTFSDIRDQIGRVHAMLERDYYGKYDNCIANLQEILYGEATSLVNIGDKFAYQCRQAHEATKDIMSSAEIKSRAQKGAEYCLAKLKVILDETFANARIDLDDAADKHKLDNLLDILRQIANIKLAELSAVAANGFSPKIMMRAKVRAIARESEPKEERNTSSSKSQTVTRHSAEANEVVNRQVYEALSQWRKKKADEIGKPNFIVASNALLFALADGLPTDSKELLKINGMGEEKRKKYGKEILEITNGFYKQGVRPAPIRKAKNKVPTGGEEQPITITIRKPTKEISLEAYKRLGSADAVAKERGLTPSTIMSHLIEFVGKEYTIEEFMGEERYKKLVEIVKKLGEGEKADPKLFDEYDYNEYHYVRKQLGK